MQDLLEWWETVWKPFFEALLSFQFREILGGFLHLPPNYYHYVITMYSRNPEHVIIETFLICFVIYITFVKRARPIEEKVRLTEAEVQELCDEWTPEPLCPPVDAATRATPGFKSIGVVEKTPGTHLKLIGIDKELINLATFDFLGLGTRKEVEKVAVDTLTKYGCGSCGPRGFYGTIDTHSKLEKDISAMLGTADTIIYSDSEATCSSVLPTFARRGDLVVVDEGCNDSIMVGANLARCTAHYYKHNDLKDLERILKSIRDADIINNRGSDCQRRYVVTEALFRNYGDMIDLPAILSLCGKYYFRLFLDESFSFGVLGAHGKGITEHYGVDISKVDILCSSMSAAVGGVGGFSAGSAEVIDYQRLHSVGYVFSASAPPFTTACTSEALRLMKNEPEMFTRLRDNAKLVHDALANKASDFVEVSSACESPLVHLRIKKSLVEHLTPAVSRVVCSDICQEIAQECMENGVAVVAPRYKVNQIYEPLASVRACVSANHTSQQLREACEVISSACKRVIGKRLNDQKNKIVVDGQGQEQANGKVKSSVPGPRQRKTVK